MAGHPFHEMDVRVSVFEENMCFLRRMRVVGPQMLHACLFFFFFILTVEYSDRSCGPMIG